MASSTGFYILYDVNGSEIYHLYEVSEITKRDSLGNVKKYKYSSNPICGQDNSNLEGHITSKALTEEDFIDKVRNILDGIPNDIRLCENCIRDIIAEKQDIFY